MRKFGLCGESGLDSRSPLYGEVGVSRTFRGAPSKEIARTE